MRTGLIGKKIGSSSFFYDTGIMVPVTIIKIDETRKKRFIAPA